MRILDWNSLDEPARQVALARPAVNSRADIARSVGKIIARVRYHGDEAIRSLTERFDRAKLGALAVTENEFEDARRTFSSTESLALKHAIRNVERFHAAQMPKPFVLETEPGVRCEQLVRPIARIGLYIPGGATPLPSSLIMLAVPARLAGCAQSVLCTPPRADGTVHPALLMAAEYCGIECVFKVGGAQAIAALAYGTQTIPKVDKIFGPGNAWVTAAKQLVAQDPVGAACDLPAGPSEVLILADDSAQPEFLAADLLAQAEHDALSQAILITDSPPLAEAVAREIRLQRQDLSRQAVLGQSLEACRGIVVSDLDSGIEIANEYAPEHLMLQVRDARGALARVRNAGSVFIGTWSAEAFGDYCSGTNHVLPTYGHARAFSGLSVRDFVKTIAVQELSRQGLQALGTTAITLARMEGLDAHANSIVRRLAAARSMDEHPTAAKAGLRA